MDKNITVIIFDFDGVIAQSVNIKTEAFAKLYEPYGNEVVKKVVEHHLANGGLSRFEKFKIYHGNYLKIELTDNQILELSNQFSSLVVQKVVKAPYVLGAYEFIRKYYQEYSFFIVSATPQNEIETIVKLKGLNTYFIKVLGSPTLKDNNINRILSDYELNISEVCYIGDSINDYKAAKKTGVKFIGMCSPDDNPFPTNVLTIDRFELFIDLLKS